MVRPPARSAPRWAALSMPRASPEMIVIPRAARSAARRSAPETIGRRLARAHDRDRESIVRLHASAHPEALGRQGNLPQIRRVRDLVAGDAHRRRGCLTLHTLSRDAHLMSMITTQYRPV